MIWYFYNQSSHPSIIIFCESLFFLFALMNSSRNSCNDTVFFPVNSTASSSSTKYDPDLLKSDVHHAKARVQRLKRELANINSEVDFKQRGVETLHTWVAQNTTVVNLLSLTLSFQSKYKISWKWPRTDHWGGQGHQGGAAEHPAVAVHGGAGEGRADEEPRLPQGWSHPAAAVREGSRCVRY